MILAIRHYPDRKRPCIVLEEGNQAVVLGYLTNKEREEWLRRAYEISGTQYQFALVCPTKDTLEAMLCAGCEVKHFDVEKINN